MMADSAGPALLQPYFTLSKPNNSGWNQNEFEVPANSIAMIPVILIGGAAKDYTIADLSWVFLDGDADISVEKPSDVAWLIKDVHQGKAKIKFSVKLQNRSNPNDKPDVDPIIVND